MKQEPWANHEFHVIDGLKNTAQNFLESGHERARETTFTNSTEDEIRRIEIEWGVAFERRDMETLDRLMADDYILTDPLGSVRTKAESLAAIERSEVHFESTKSDNVNVRINGDTAVVTGRSTFRGRYKGWSMAGQYQYTDVLVKRSGSWKAVGSHISAVGVGMLRLSFGRLVSNWL
ncbi:MAG TPA: nuclear transport factor 2 family protein [Pyrinomonadaceae bacterium]